MSKDFPMVALGEVLARQKDEIDIQELNTYARLTIRLKGQGIVIRDRVLGSEIGTKKQFMAKTGQLVLSKIDARNGAFGLLSDECDGAIITGNFWAFEVNHERLDAQYFNYLTKTPLFIDFCIRASEGTTNRRYLQEQKFLAQQIPLPPIEEQRSLVVRIEQLAAKIAEARGLRSKALQETKALLPSVVEQVLKTLRDSAEEVTVESIAKSVTDGDHQPPPKADSGIPFIFINHVAGGKINFSGCKWVPLEYFSCIAASRVPKPGDVLYTAVGSYGIPCLVETNEPFCFQRHIAIIKPDQSLILSKYLTWVLSSPDILNQATKAATGSAQLTVPLRGIRKLKFPLPPLSEQRRIVAYLDNLQSKVDALKQMQAETTAELNALLPSILDKAFKGEL